jgi:hypothetical protein
MGRPKKDDALKQIGAMVSPEMARTIRDYAEYLRLSQSWVIHQLLSRGLRAVELDGFLIDSSAPLPPKGRTRSRPSQN